MRTVFVKRAMAAYVDARSHLFKELFENIVWDIALETCSLLGLGCFCKTTRFFFCFLHLGRTFLVFPRTPLVDFLIGIVPFGGVVMERVFGLLLLMLLCTQEVVRDHSCPCRDKKKISHS